MFQDLEDTFLKALEENQQKLLGICSVIIGRHTLLVYFAWDDTNHVILHGICIGKTQTANENGAPEYGAPQCRAGGYFLLSK